MHFQSRGESVFRAICQNCHGRNADSNSPLSATIIEVTGGQTRVANFVAGLFGPPTAPGAFAREQFLVDRGATPEDWQARYLLFMGLGGTEATIPQIVLDLVATSPFYGKGITAPGPKNANMLGSAEQLCYFVLGSTRLLETRGPSDNPLDNRPSVKLEDDSRFSSRGGHYELWESLCTHDNEPVVRVFTSTPGLQKYNDLDTYRAKDDSGNWIYPLDAPVGNQFGDVEIGIRRGNTLPWCIQARDPEEKDAAHKWSGSVANPRRAPEGSIPFCPPALFTRALEPSNPNPNDPTTSKPIYRLAFTVAGRDVIAGEAFGNQAFTQRWVRKGAINAGLSAYYYLRGRLSHEIEPSLPFDFCQQ